MEKEYQALFKRIQEVATNVSSSNHDRRVLCAEVELFRIKLETTAPRSDEEKVTQNAQLSEIDAMLNAISLKKEKHYWYDNIDRWICGITGWVWLLTATCFLTPPVMLIKPLDVMLVKKGMLSPHSQISEHIQKFIANVMLLISGADLTVIDGDVDAFAKSNCPLVTFSHGSTLDTFVLGSLIPMRQNTMAKKELFLVPYLNVLLYTFGGIPIDRTDRNAAVRAIQKATSAAASGGTCIMIAPEGTRSKTGHLLPFKKGPFYIWEDLQSTIIPVVITGAYELCPPGICIAEMLREFIFLHTYGDAGYFMNLPGRIYAQQLAPIPFIPGQSRESISVQLRVQMLEAIRRSPRDAGSAISWGFRLKSIVAIVSVALLQYFIYEVPCKMLMDKFQISFQMLFMYNFCVAIIATIALYFFKILLPKMEKAPTERSPSKASTPVKLTINSKVKTRKAD